MDKIKEKAEYCLNCINKPCQMKGCPLHNNIPNFIKEVKNENYQKAYEILSQTTVLSGVCGRVCPHQKQCQGSCIRGIKGEPVQIGELEAFVFDKVVTDKNALKNVWKKSNQTNILSENLKNKNVAIIGGGPAGLTAATFLAKENIQVTIYEKHSSLGGLLVHGIPEFRLERDIIKKTIDNIIKLGIDVKLNMQLGKNLNIKELENKYDAILVAIGANCSSKMNVEGEDLDGVYGGNELLEYNLHPNYKGKVVSVVGGGNVAIDCARTILRMGAKEVKVIYRRAKEQMPAEEKEVEMAMKENVKFLFQNNIVKIIGKNNVEKIELIKTRLVQKKGESRLVPENIENSNYIIDSDYVIMALGSKPEKNIKENLEKNKKIYFAGDFETGRGTTVANAAFSGREKAKEIINDFKNAKL